MKLSSYSFQPTGFFKNLKKSIFYTDQLMAKLENSTSFYLVGGHLDIMINNLDEDDSLIERTFLHRLSQKQTNSP